MPAYYSTSTATLTAGVWAFSNPDPTWTILGAAGAWPPGYRPATIQIDITVSTNPITSYDIFVYDTASGLIGSYSGSAAVGTSSQVVALTFGVDDIGSILVGGTPNMGFTHPIGDISILGGSVVGPFWRDFVYSEST